MAYNFDVAPKRENTNSVKYDLREKLFGKPDVLPMWVADMDFATPDFIIDALKERLEHKVLGYTFRSDAYYQSIVDWCKRRYGWEIKKEWICFSPGIVPAVNMALMAYTEPEEKVIIQPPVYFPFFSAIQNNDRELVTNPLLIKNGRFHIDWEDLEKKMPDAKALIISNPHNPGGTVWTKQELKKLCAYCDKYDVLLLSDEIHGDLIFNPNRFVPAASVSEDAAMQTISFIAPSKTFNLAGMATSSVIIPNEELRAGFNEVVEQVHVGNGNIMGAVASEAAYNKGDQWLDEMLAYVWENVQTVEAFLKEELPEVKMMVPEGTYLIWLDFKHFNMTGKELEEFMVNEAHLGFNKGAMFGEGGEGYMRMNVACPRATVMKALKQLKQAFTTKK